MSFGYAMGTKAKNLKFLTSSKFDLFQPIICDEGIVSSHTLNIQCNSQGGPYEFNIEPDPEKWTDITTMLLHGEMEIQKKKSDGTWEQISDSDAVAPVNNIFHSIFSTASIKVMDTDIGETNGMTYPYGAYLQTLLSSNDEVRDTILHSKGFIMDNNDQFDALTLSGGNMSFLLRRNLFKAKKQDFVIPIHNDLMTVKDKLFPPNVKFQVQLKRSADSFCLMTDDSTQEYRVALDKIRLTVDRYAVEPEVNKQYFKGLKESVPTLPFTQNVMKTYTVPQNNNDLSCHNLFFGNRLPDKVLIMLVDQDAFSGSLKKNPYNFKTFQLSEASLLVDSVSEPSQPLTWEEDKDEKDMYFSFLANTGTAPFEMNSVPITLPAYKGGSFLIAFDRTPGRKDSGVTHKMKGGYMSIRMKTKEKLSNNITVIVYASYDSKLEIIDDKAIVSYAT